MVRNHKDINKIKFGIFFTVIILAFTFFLINSFIINQLRNELNNQVKTIANIYHEKLTNENVDSQYLLDTLLPLINELQIPMIISTKKNIALIKIIKGSISKKIEGAFNKVKKTGSIIWLSLFWRNFISSNKFIIIIITKKTALTFKKFKIYFEYKYFL